MLRTWPPRGLARPLQTPRRAFWGRAAQILGLTKDECTPKGSKTDEAQTNDAVSHGQSRIPVRPQPQKGVKFPVRKADVGADQILEGKRAFAALSQHLALASTPNKLLDTWSLVSRCQPFVIADGKVRLLDGENAELKSPSLPVLQMLPADVFAQETVGVRLRTMFVTSSASRPMPDIVAVADVANANVIATNEAVVVALLVEYLSTLGDHKRAIRFFEAYNSDRRKWLSKRLAASDDDAAMASFERITRLWVPARVGYVKSLLAEKSYQKLPQFAREDKRNLKVFSWSGAAMSQLLRACAEQKDTALSLMALDSMSARRPRQVRFYEETISRVLRDKEHSEQDLESALTIARHMQDDAGYVIQPDMWFALINASLHKQQTKCALEFFSLYMRDDVSPYQDCFRRPFRKACRLNQPELVLTMVRQWLAAAKKAPEDSEDNAVKRADVLKFVMVEMLVCKHPASFIREMVGILEAEKVTMDSEIRWLVDVLLEDDSRDRPARDAIKRALDFWKKHSSVYAPGFLMHLVLEQCLKRQWLDECELVVSKIGTQKLQLVPCNTLVKVMDANIKRGQFGHNVKMGDALVASLPRAAFRSLNQHFYDRYLKSLLQLGCFDKVCQQSAKLNLRTRFQANAEIAASLREAEVQVLQREASR